MRGTILFVDDDRTLCETLAQGLGRRTFEVTWTQSPEEALRLIQERPFDAVLTDMNMPQMSGTDLCKRITAYLPDLPVIVLTAFGSMDTAIAAIRAGAYDFVTKPVELDGMALTLDRAVNHRALREEVKRLRRAVESARPAGALVGESVASILLETTFCVPTELKYMP